MAVDNAGIKTFKNLRWRYLLALSAIALTILVSQIILQYYIAQQVSDSREVNLSGRQRMLSQRITKSAMMLFNTSDDADRSSYYEELQKSLAEWKAAHHGLQHGDPDLGVKGSKHPNILTLFNQIEPHFSEMVAGAEGILLQESFSFDGESNRHLDKILANEGRFLEGMDALVFEFDRLAQRKVNQLQRIEFYLFLVALFIIFIELKYIFFPSAKLIKRTFEDLEENEANARKMALEISALYESLERSFHDLAEAEIVLEDFTVFAKCDSQGEFLSFGDKFLSIMVFEDSRPTNFFKWLAKQGQEEDFINELKLMLAEGQTWEGELKLVTNEGDFVWLKVHLVPLYPNGSASEGFLLISADETEVKEAQEISQEIHQEKLERKLKEQQFRSALILEGQEEERKRISRDLHDGIGQYLTALKYSIEGINDVKTYQEEKRLEVSKRLIGDVIKEVRRISFHLTPVALSDYGLAPVLQKFSEEMSKISKIPIQFESSTNFHFRLEPKIENNLYRIVQEAVNNAIKYSEASFIKISISHSDNFILLKITDDGKGFNYEQLKEDGYFHASGHGLFNIKERVNFIDGNFKINTAPGAGTVIEIELPLVNIEKINPNKDG